jgi:phosphoribosylglycinamide formyltransferase
MATRQTRITVLISGSGTNLQALIDAQEKILPKGAKIIRVISNKKDAFGITRAQAANIPTSYHNLLKYKKDPKFEGDVPRARVAYDEDLAKLVLRDEPDLVVCAGFMHILSPGFLEPLEKGNVKIINLHPGMLTLFLSTLG